MGRELQTLNQQKKLGHGQSGLPPVVTGGKI